MADQEKGGGPRANDKPPACDVPVPMSRVPTETRDKPADAGTQTDKANPTTTNNSGPRKSDD
jgi:hypothetical protein